MATLRQNIVVRSSELRTSVLETALGMGIQNETVAKWVFENVVEEEEEEDANQAGGHSCDRLMDRPEKDE